jgi:hypothetical protein
MTEHGTCSHDPGEAAREESRRLTIGAAIVRMARAAGTPVHQRPVWPGAASTFRYADPAAGMRYARMLADAARRAERQYIKHGREDGMTWHQIGEALNLTHCAQERGAPVAEVAFEYAAGAEHAQPWETLTFGWRCQSCCQYVSDRGPYNGHPADDEHGHTGGCARLAAAVAAWETSWAELDEEA